MSPRIVPLLVVLAGFVAACSTSGDAGTTAEATRPVGASRLVVWSEDRIGIVEDDGVDPVEAGGTISQVTAGPNGPLVWTTLESSPPRARAVIENGSRLEIDTSTVPFFYEWNPTGTRVAFLGNSASAGGLVFGLIDVASERVTALESPSPFFFDWSPDGERLIAHVGGGSLGIIDADTGEVDDLGENSGLFPAPAWLDVGIVIVVEQAPTVSRVVVPVAFQRSMSLVVLLDPDSGATRELASVDGPVRLFPGPEALALVVGTSGSQRIDILDWSGNAVATLGSGTIDLAQWSPDGRTLLWTERSDDVSLEPRTWDGAETTVYESFTPSDVFATAYLPFWDQYDRAMSVWSSDSASFVLPVRTDEGPAVVVRGLDGSDVVYPGWDMATWLPPGSDGRPPRVED